jgi:hypothetical protein
MDVLVMNELLKVQGPRPGKLLDETEVEQNPLDFKLEYKPIGS